MKQRLNWDDIQYLLRLVEERSVSGAARCLGVEHSTVVRRLNRMEETLGAKFFDRLPRLWQPTDEAMALIATAREIERQALSLERKAKTAQDQRRIVRVSVTPLLAELILIPGLAQFPIEHVNIEMQIQSEVSLSDIGRNEAEIAIRLNRTADQDLTTRRVATVRYGVFGVSGLADKRPPDWRWIGFDDTLAGSQLASWYEERLDGNRVVARAGDFRSLAAGAVNGWGVALLPTFLAREYPDLVLLQDDVPTLDVALVTHRDLLENAAVRKVFDQIANVFRKAEF